MFFWEFFFQNLKNSEAKGLGEKLLMKNILILMTVNGINVSESRRGANCTENGNTFIKRKTGTILLNYAKFLDYYDKFCVSRVGGQRASAPAAVRRQTN